MTERPTHVVLTSLPDGMHYVAVRRGEWFQAVASFFELERAEQYCEIENDMLRDGEDLRPDVAEVPETPAPESNVRAERFIRAEPDSPLFSLSQDEINARATVLADARLREATEGATTEPEPVVAEIATTGPEPVEQEELADDPGDDDDDAPLADAEAPDAPWVEEEPSGRKLPGQQFRRKGEEPPRPKPVTAGWSTERDPNLVREPETKELGGLPKGSSSQQLADRIEAELPELMRLHFHGPIIADLVSHYKEPEARIVGAVRYLVLKRKVSLVTVDGQKAQHVAPYGFEVEQPNGRGGAHQPVDHEGRRKTVLKVLRDASEDGLVKMSVTAIARRAEVPLGSITALMKDLTKSGALEVVKKADVKAKEPAQYRVVA